MKILGQNAFWQINKKLAKEVGIEASLLLSDLIDKNEYFKERGELDDEGYFYNTSQNIENDTTLSYKLQKKNIKILVEKGFIYTKVKGMPAKVHFCINNDKIQDFILYENATQGEESGQNKYCPKVKTSIAQKSKLVLPKSQSNNNKEIIIKNNNKELSKDNKETEVSLNKKTETFGNSEINKLLEIIKREVENIGFIYKPGKQERNRARNILQNKTIKQLLEKTNMDLEFFIKNIIKASSIIKYGNFEINNAVDFYYKYDKVYNKMISLKSKKIEEEQQNESVGYLNFDPMRL